MFWISLILSVGLLFLGAPLARAETYSFVDEDGVVHFTNVPTDARYKRVGPFKPKRSSGKRAPFAGRKAGPIQHQLFKQYREHIQEASTRYSIPTTLIRAVMAVESNFNPKAVSSAGAMGLMQLMPQTASEMGVSDPYDPRQNILGGARYLRVMANQYSGDLVLTLAAYNAGHTHVSRYMDVPPFAETQDYVRRVLSLYAEYRDEDPASPPAASAPAAP
jgi:soluble lytic murein transglycosylase-like protein